MAQIGIKLADGSFYALFDESGAVRKRVVLTPAGADQRVARVELLRKDGVETHHVGHLILEDIDGSSSDLELEVGLDAAGNLDASMSNLSSGEYQNLAVNVYQLDDTETVSLDDVDEFNVSAVGDTMDDIGLPDFDEDPFSTDDVLADSTDQPPSLDDDFSSLDQFATDGDESRSVDDGGLSDVDDLPMPNFEDEIDTEPNIHADLAGLESEAQYRSDVDEEIFQERAQPRPFRPIVLGALLLIGIGITAVAAFGVYLWLSDQWSLLRAAMLLPITVGRFGLRRRDR